MHNIKASRFIVVFFVYKIRMLKLKSSKICSRKILHSTYIIHYNSIIYTFTKH